MINKGILLLVLTMTLASCINDQPILSGTYFSYWYETSFEFTFLPNGNFKMETGGHFGETTTTGRYAMLDTIVFLLPDSDDVLHNGFGIYVDRLIYRPKENCLQDFQSHVYCSTEPDYLVIAEREYNVMQKIEERLMNLPEVVQYIETRTDTTVHWVDRPKMEFRGIRTLRQEYYFEYMLKISKEVREADDPYFVNAYIRPFLVSVPNNMIYREEHQTGQDLTKVDVLFTD
jgi:hypothetical protein